MAEELRQYDIAVNALSPGPVRSATWERVFAEGITLQGKDPVPEVLGPALLFLVGQSATGMTGQIVHNDQFGINWPSGSH